MSKAFWIIRFLWRVSSHANSRYYHHLGWHAYSKTPEQCADDLFSFDTLSKRNAVLCGVLQRWMLFSEDVSCGCAAGDDDLRMLRDRTERLLSPNAELCGARRASEPTPGSAAD